MNKATRVGTFSTEKRIFFLQSQLWGYLIRYTDFSLLLIIFMKNPNSRTLSGPDKIKFMIPSSENCYTYTTTFIRFNIHPLKIIRFFSLWHYTIMMMMSKVHESVLLIATNPVLFIPTEYSCVPSPQKICTR